MILPVKELKEALDIVKPAISSNAVVPILENVKIQIKDKKVSLTGSDLETTITKTFGCSEAKDAEFLVNFQTLHGFIKLVNTTDVEIITNEENYNIQVKAGKSKAQIEGENIIDYPKIQTEEAKTIAIISTHAFQEIIEKVVPFVMTDQNDHRMEFKGVSFKAKGDKLKVEGSDTHRISTLMIEAEIKEDFEIVMNRRMTLINQVFKEEQPLTLKINKSNYVIEGSESSIMGLLIDERFPDTDKVKPNAKDMFKATFERNSVLLELSRAKVFANEKSKFVKLSLNKTKAGIYSNDINYNKEYNGEVECEHSGEDMDIGLNVFFLHQAVSLLEGEDIDFYHTGADNRPTIIREDKLEILIMPVMLEY